MSSVPSTDRAQRTGKRPTTLGTALREARVRKGESLAQVAAATGVSKSLLSLIENDRSDVTLRRLALLAEHYGIALGDILPTRGTTDPVVTRRKERRVMKSPPKQIRDDEARDQIERFIVKNAVSKQKSAAKA